MNEGQPTLEIPQTGFAGLSKNLKNDGLSGFLVFLIALPLCLAIANASGFPPIAGILTAVIGGLLCLWISNSELTIKGPAAGMIAIVAGAMADFGFTEGKDAALDAKAYHYVLAVGVASGVVQILFGLFKAGKLGDFFPTAAVHGLLASIGIIIMSKQIHAVLGVKPAASEPLHLIAEIPESILHLNVHITIVGLLSLALMFGLPLLKKRVRLLQVVPAQLIVLVIAIPLGKYFELQKEQVYIAKEEKAREEPKVVLVPLPPKVTDAIQFPDFHIFRDATMTSLKWLIMFSLVGTLESLLSAKAIDLLDPWQRKTNFDRDILAVGVANTASAALGGLPMISEIVRSSANITNGARTRLANTFHGIFLLLFVVLLPDLIRSIPLSALGAMLVYTGFRLASPKEFIHMYKIGAEQFAIFVITVIAVLATDLLIGIGVGVLTKFVIHLLNGVSPRAFFTTSVTTEESSPNHVKMTVRRAAIFSHWIGLKKQIERHLFADKDLTIDLAQTKLVDHTVMEKLHELEREFSLRGHKLTVTGLEHHRPSSDHPRAARKLKL